MSTSEQDHVYGMQPEDRRWGTGVIYWHKLTAMQTLSSGWTGAFVVTEKVSVVDYIVKLNPEGSSKVVHVDQLWLDRSNQDRTNWVRDELDRVNDVNNVVDRGTSPSPTKKVTMSVSISCQTNDIELIVARSRKNTHKIAVHKSERRKGKPIRLVYYQQI